jgi:hypothetical protein
MNAATELPAIDVGAWSDDLVWGAPGIAVEIGRTERQAIHLLTTGKLPAKKIGGRWVSRRSALRALFAMPGAAA